MISLFLLVATVVASTTGSQLRERSLTECPAQAAIESCFIRDLDSGMEKQVVNGFAYSPNGGRYSIRCNVAGPVDHSKWTLGNGEVSDDWAQPFWMNNNDDVDLDHVWDADYLATCGEKSFTIQVFVWGVHTPCAGKNLSFDASCEIYPPIEGSRDLGIRFNKFAYDKDLAQRALLGPSDYPLSDSTSAELKTSSNAVSIITSGDILLGNGKLDEYINKIGGPPTMPTSDPNNPFWEEFAEVVTAQIDRRNSELNYWGWPDLWDGYDVHKVAEAVHDEYPGYEQSRLIEKLWAAGVKVDHDILPFRSKSDFVGRQIAMATLNTWAIGTIAGMNFHAKWHYGRPRPEEIAWLITTGELTEENGVPPAIIADVLSMELKRAEDFTAYPEGCPRHPAWPAMHSAASTVSLWSAVVLKDIPSDLLCEARRIDYAVAFARTIAGVHYSTDNTAGLNLGAQLLMDKLPGYLEEMYGSNPDAVRKKMNSYVIDWSQFDPESCST